MRWVSPQAALHSFDVLVQVERCTIASALAMGRVCMAFATKAFDVRARALLLGAVLACCGVFASSEPLIEVLFSSGPGFTYWTSDGALILQLKNATSTVEWTMANR